MGCFLGRGGELSLPVLMVERILKALAVRQVYTCTVSMSLMLMYSTPKGRGLVCARLDQRLHDKGGRRTERLMSRSAVSCCDGLGRHAIRSTGISTKQETHVFKERSEYGLLLWVE